ncbi:MAG: hypothetical protein GXP30_15275 [Verrucomicrobia bacterium]|nr:hypothetical protein [Verrucomicrobiota bacterium]
MTDSDPQEKVQLLKTDVMGRVHTTREQRELILDSFETGALSGPEFAQVHGIKYRTFATWRQKRRRQRGGYDKTKSPAKSPSMELTLAEAAHIELVEAEPKSRRKSTGTRRPRIPEDLPIVEEIILPEPVKGCPQA